MATRLSKEGVKELIRLLPKFHLRALNRVHVKFDPFHYNAGSLRQFIFFLSYPAVRNSNPKCAVKTEVVCDNSEPEIKVQTESGHKILFKAGNLNQLELVQEYLKVVGRFDTGPSTPAEEPEKAKPSKKSKRR